MMVQLTWREVRLAAIAGVDRRLHALYLRCKDRHGAPSDDRGWQLDIEGALGECVLARALNLYWANGWFETGDVARHQVRATSRTDGRLIVRPNDPDDVPFVLVVGIPPTFRVAGWISGRDAKTDRFLLSTDPNRAPAYFVPQSALRPMSDLVEVP